MKMVSNNKIAAFALLLFFVLAFFLYFELHLSTGCPSTVADEEQNDDDGNASKEKPIVLLWFWPVNLKFDLTLCPQNFKINGCVITADRSLYSKAKGVVIYHADIDQNLGNLPQGPRPAFQKWIWFHVEPPTGTKYPPGLENLFNLTATYRRDSDIVVRQEFTIKDPGGAKNDFVLPKKDKLVCWIVTDRHRPGTVTRERYYAELSKHVKVHLFGGWGATFLNDDLYYPTIASCKFYLAFENSIHRDYITEKPNGAFVAGTVPIVLGPPRDNYHQFYTPDSFIHVDDFPDVKSMAEFLLDLDKKDDEYMHYFEWREFYTVTPHDPAMAGRHLHPLCLTCEHLVKYDNAFSVVHDLYKWWLMP